MMEFEGWGPGSKTAAAFFLGLEHKVGKCVVDKVKFASVGCGKSGFRCEGLNASVEVHRVTCFA